MLVNIRKLPRHELIKLNLNMVGGGILTDQDVMYIFSALGVWYNYDYAQQFSALPPHAVLPNEQHTDTYFKHLSFFNSSSITEILAIQLSRRLGLGNKIMDLSPRERAKENPIWVIGPDSAALLVSALASYWQCWQGTTHKVVGGDHEWPSLSLPKNSVVQLIDDFVRSAYTLDHVHGAILEDFAYGQMFIQVQNEVGAIVNMTGKDKIQNGWKIVSLINLKPKIWPKDNCLLCQAGSTAVSVQHSWHRLADSCWHEPSD